MRDCKSFIALYMIWPVTHYESLVLLFCQQWRKSVGKLHGIVSYNSHNSTKPLMMGLITKYWLTSKHFIKVDTSLIQNIEYRLLSFLLTNQMSIRLQFRIWVRAFEAIDYLKFAFLFIPAAFEIVWKMHFQVVFFLLPL